jgi:hypothetical protein
MMVLSPMIAYRLAEDALYQPVVVKDKTTILEKNIDCR